MDGIDTRHEIHSSSNITYIELGITNQLAHAADAITTDHINLDLIQLTNIPNPETDIRGDTDKDDHFSKQANTNVVLFNKFSLLAEGDGRLLVQSDQGRTYSRYSSIPEI